MAKLIHYGIIGCGMMGGEHIRNIDLLDDATVSVIFEPDLEMANKAQMLAPDAVLVSSIAELLAHEKLDCILIVSPNFRHLEQLEEIAATRPMPILVEKPLFTDPDHVNRLKEFKDSFPAPVWVAMEYRYMPPIAALLTEAEKVTGGIKMLTIREHRFPFLEKVGDWNRFNKNTGGTFVEKCCHFFDLMRLILKAEPIRVMASAAQSVNHLDEEYDGQTPDIIDNGYVLIDFDNGARAVLELCMFAEGSKYQEEVSAVGPEGKIEALVPGPGRFWPKELGPAPVPKLVMSPRMPQGVYAKEIPVDPDLLEAGDHNGSTFYQHRNFLKLVRGELDQPEVTLDDGWAAVAMGIAAQISAAEGRVIDSELDALMPK